MLKTLKYFVRVAWVYRRSQWVALFTTDLDLSVEQVIECYGACWKIESGFKEIKQNIGSTKSQTWNPHAVTNHLNFCMMAATITWIYVDRLGYTPKRCYAVNNRKHFAFSDVRKLITQAALNNDFGSVCPKPGKPAQKHLLPHCYAWSHREIRETLVIDLRSPMLNASSFLTKKSRSTVSCPMTRCRSFFP